MNKRDKLILDDLKRFRVLSRDQLIQLHFNHLKQKILVCNNVMKRLRREGYVKADTTSNPYNYFPVTSTMKKDSMKIPHFKALTDFYIEICKHGKPSIFNVEPKYSDKGTVEPDIFMIWMGSPIFVEIQRNVYTEKVMQQKINRYMSYYNSGLWKEESWQKGKKYFPYIWIITEHRYKLTDVKPLTIMQTRNANEFVDTYVRKTV